MKQRNNKMSPEASRIALQKEVTSLLPWDKKIYYLYGRLPKPRRKPPKRIPPGNSLGYRRLKSNRADRRATMMAIQAYLLSGYMVEVPNW